MKVKVHPHKPMVDNGSEACISITPDKRHGRAYYMGTVTMADVMFRIHESGLARARSEDVRNVHAWAVGELIHETVERNEPTPKMLDVMVPVFYNYQGGRFVWIKPLAPDQDEDEPRETVDLTDRHFNAAYMCGPDIYVSKDGLL